LSPEQVAFLRALLALNVRDFTSYSEVVRYAESLYLGEVRFNWKDIPGTVIRGLESAGLVEFQKRPKKGVRTPQGRGGKPGFIRPTKKFEQQIADPLLKLMFRTARFATIREIRRRSLADILADLKSSNAQKSGTALEYLAVRLCMMLDLEFMEWRTTDLELTAGGEVDALLHAARLIYSRWQVQCKVGAITLEAVAKEVGMQTVTLANVILVVSNGKVSSSAATYREHITRTSHLNIIYIDGSALQRINKDPNTLLDVLRQQAREALSLKPKPGLKSNNSGEIHNIDQQTSIIREEPRDYGTAADSKLSKPFYETAAGAMYCGDALQLLPWLIASGHRARLILTSPPFALVRKKEYGNEDSDTYIEWFVQFIPLFKQILEPRGSLVIDIGGAWIKGIAAKSTYQFKLLLRLCESGFYLAQDFYHYNPSKLPTPAEWVTVRRMRVKDAINNVWWLMQDPMAPVDNRRVLAPYSESMQDLLKHGYKPAVRPSGHDISNKFQKDNGGAIPPNLLQFPNTDSQSHYIRRCKEESIRPHPARFPRSFADFFIRFLTDENDLVYDPFAGSNMTGFVAEDLNRRWIATEMSSEYATGSKFRFEQPSPKPSKLRHRRTKTLPVPDAEPMLL
jgi:site-specific DNA-methyltransferase (cytosine-N4-specific)